ncbi:nitrogen regulatory IIA protein [Chryseobacterium sp. SL1]|uniref:nitrogen regulatory IIA protein n=1 Tax=Chryseobacterium sp. SL1 TaxID=2995159 RepID=UPI00227570B4|nr:nitrogen regulatory IIA protein [Chryseobacterium sp. SL1]MCY1662615.1 nitrogen regulatory IIA protein [Chryseobacterium sp. SL1]
MKNMKRLKALRINCENRIEEYWHSLSPRKQRRFVLLFFTGYLLVTGCVILKVWHDGKADAQMRKNEIEHIRNPTLQSKKQFGDSSSIILKNQEHEGN